MKKDAVKGQVKEVSLFPPPFF